MCKLNNVVWLFITKKNHFNSGYFDDNNDLTVEYKFIVLILYSIFNDCVGIDGVTGVDLECWEQTEYIVYHSLLCNRVVELSHLGKQHVLRCCIFNPLHIADVNLPLKSNIKQSIIVGRQLLYLIKSNIAILPSIDNSLPL